MQLRIIVTALLIIIHHAAMAQTPSVTAFTYQGLLRNNGQPVNGVYDLAFSLYNSATGGETSPLATVNLPNWPVNNGLVQATLDFGASLFDGKARFLEVCFRSTGSADPCKTLPRQQLFPSPYALYASSASYANGFTNTGNLRNTGNLLVTDDASGASVGIGGGSIFMLNGANYVGLMSDGTFPGPTPKPKGGFVIGAWMGTTSLVVTNDAWVGGNLTVMGTVYSHLVNGSDRNTKENFSAIDKREILSKLVATPISTWNYKGESAPVRHIGPMSQDFAAAFGLGRDDKHIFTVDADGVALAAIQGLNQIVEEKDAELNALKKRVAELERLVGASTK